MHEPSCYARFSWNICFECQWNTFLNYLLFSRQIVFCTSKQKKLSSFLKMCNIGYFPLEDSLKPLLFRSQKLSLIFQNYFFLTHLLWCWPSFCSINFLSFSGWIPVCICMDSNSILLYLHLDTFDAPSSFRPIIKPIIKASLHCNPCPSYPLFDHFPVWIKIFQT